MKNSIIEKKELWLKKDSGQVVDVDVGEILLPNKQDRKYIKRESEKLNYLKTVKGCNK